MKKSYKTPVVEKVKFEYETVVVASGPSCGTQWANYNPDGRGCIVNEGGLPTCWAEIKVMM